MLSSADLYINFKLTKLRNNQMPLLLAIRFTLKILKKLKNKRKKVERNCAKLRAITLREIARNYYGIVRK